MIPALPREDVTAGVLAVAVHGFFILLMVFGLSWQIHDPQPIMAELWQSLPEPSQPVPEAVKPVEPEPQPEPKPVVEPKPDLRAAEIALEKEKKKKEEERKKKEEAKLLALKELEQKKKLEEEKKAKALARQKEEARKKLMREEALAQELAMEREAARLEAEKFKREQEKKLADLKRREALRMEEELMQKQMMEEAMAAEAAQAKARAAAAQRASEIQKMVDLYKAKISERVRSYTRLPENLAGNPEAEFEVNVLPTGEVNLVRLTKSSGNTAFDDEVMRGIKKASPLPLPADRDALALFRKFILKHRAKE